MQLLNGFGDALIVAAELVQEFLFRVDVVLAVEDVALGPDAADGDVHGGGDFLE